MKHRFVPQIQARDEAETFPGAGGDDLSLRVNGEGGECPVAVIEGVSEDRAWVPLHSHPWDELTYVLDGEIEFRVGGDRATGTAGTIVALPRDVPHSLRVRSGTARYLIVTLGAPSVAFLEEIGRAYAEGPTLERLIEIAGRHGVKPVAD